MSELSAGGASLEFFAPLEPERGGYRFSLDAGEPLRGRREAFRARGSDGRTFVEYETDLEPSLTLQTRYTLIDDLIFVRHKVENSGSEPVPLAPWTCAAWRREALGGDARLHLKQPDGNWTVRALPAVGEMLEFREFERPAGVWALEGQGSRRRIEESFSIDFVTLVRIRTGRDAIELELHFAPHALKPGTCRVLDTAWQFATA
ncbi:MAG: hypothetical protein AMXMBFR7_35200 [Planctomycetota bacterium]